MDLTKDQFKTITELLDIWSKDSTLEVEASFGHHHVVDSNTFLQIAQRLQTKGYTPVPQEDRLSIITPNRMRISLQSLGVIEDYCNDNTIHDKPFTIMNKKSISSKSPLDINEYDIRIKMQQEEDISRDDHRVVSLLQQWSTQPKAFRMIRRWSFNGKGVRVDMSMVRQSAMDPKGGFVWSTSFIDARITKQMIRYEVEVELLHDTELTNTVDNARKALIAGVGEVQRAIQKNSLLIRKSVAAKVRADYRKLVGDDKFRGVGPVTFQLDNMLPVMDAVKAVTDASDTVDASDASDADGVAVAAAIDKSQVLPNIRTGYNVTDKADGIRAMGFIDSSGELFLLDQSMNVYRTGLSNPAYRDTLVDGEWVTYLKDGTAINRYLVFDMYIYRGEMVSRYPFITVKDGRVEEDSEVHSRYAKVQAFFTTPFEIMPSVAKIITDTNRLVLICKEFRFASGNEIFTQCARVLANDRVYNTDGLIITSNSEPIPDKFGVRFNQQLKWKPAKDNTVDFLVNFEQDEQGGEDLITTSIDEVTGLSIQYKTMRLYVGGIRNTSYDNPRSTILQEYSLDDKDKGKYRPVLFQPFEFADQYANQCYGKITTDHESFEEYVITEHTKEPIQNNSIVEMRYDPTAEPGWRWIPTRIRHDKTERLLRAQSQRGDIKYSGMMNDENVANSVWNSIHDPVTPSMITTGNQEPEENEVAISVATDMTKKYYDSTLSKKNKTYVQGLADFHNKYIKNSVLIASTLNQRNQRLLDITCGVGGDLNKWKWANASYVMGIDISDNNINNPIDGAYKRYLKLKEKFGDRVPKIIFAVGDSSKSIVTGEAGATPEDRDIMRSVFGKTSPEGALPPYLTNVMKRSFEKGADVVSCMFAIHYFFKDSASLDGLLANLSDTLKVGGYFIGCCFDGETVFNMLQSIETGHAKVGKDKNVQLWSIRKDYTADSLPADDTSLGLGINVEFISIGAAYTEYLVPFDLLVAKLKTIGVELLTQQEASHIGLAQSTSMFSKSYDMAKASKHTYPMTPLEKEYSFLNRWFIFRRRNVVALPADLVQEAPLPPLSSVASLHPKQYQSFSEAMIKEDPSYALYKVVQSSHYSVLKPWHKEQVKNIVTSWITPSSIKRIVDGTSHIGVDTIYLSELFPSAIIDAYEVVPEIMVALRHNIITFGKEDQIIPHLQDITTWTPTTMVDLLFVDPPWGGHGYDQVDKLNLYFQAEDSVQDESKNAKTLLMKWVQSGYIKNIIIKVPKNFDDTDYAAYQLPTPVYADVFDRRKGGKRVKMEYRLLWFKGMVVESNESEVVPNTAGPNTAGPNTAGPSAATSSAATLSAATPSAAGPNATGPSAAINRKNKNQPTEPAIKVFKFGATKEQNKSAPQDDAVTIQRWQQVTDAVVPYDELPRNAAIWLGMTAPFMLPDINAPAPKREAYNSITAYKKEVDAYLVKVNASKHRIYPTMEYYLNAMRIKFVFRSEKPNPWLQMTASGKHHAKFIDMFKNVAPYSKDFFEVVDKESTSLKKLIQKLNDDPAVKFDDELWSQLRGQFIDFAIQYRLAHDPIFQHIVTSLKNDNYTLQYAVRNAGNSLATSEVGNAIAESIMRLS
jgi:mRNA (guanine-N7-)-methyltransferase